MNAIHIQQLRFRGGESQKRLLIADLDRIAWPAVSEREFLFIKRLSAQNPPGQLAGSLAKQAFDYRAAAVSGWHVGADRQDAVYFGSHAELLACLSRDLLQNHYCWYWQQWADWFKHNPESALVNCWQQQQSLIPAVLQQLAERQLLTWFCQQLPDSLVTQLCQVICPGIKLSDIYLHPISRSDLDRIIPDSWLIPWQNVFAANTFSLPVMQLAALVILKQWQPLRILQGDELPVFRLILSRIIELAGQSARQYRLVDDLADQHVAADHQAQTVFNDSNLTIQTVNDSKAISGPMPIQPKTDHQAEQILVNTAKLGEAELPQSIVPQSIDGADGLQAVKARGLNVEFVNASNQPDTVNDFLSKHHIITGQGGLLYLLNFLNLPQVQQSLLSDLVSRDYPSAWGWLWRLALELGWQAEQELENLIANFCGFAQADALNQLPDLPQMSTLLLWGRQRYGEQLFNQDLFPIEAVLEIDASHVDVFYKLDAVRLDVRRAGLDVDPGWLPWLGKVVRFHYGALPIV